MNLLLTLLCLEEQAQPAHHQGQQLKKLLCAQSHRKRATQDKQEATALEHKKRAEQSHSK